MTEEEKITKEERKIENSKENDEDFFDYSQEAIKDLSLMFPQSIT